MSEEKYVRFNATESVYADLAKELFTALQSGDEDAQWRIKWVHPRFREKNFADVAAAKLDLDLSDAQLVVAKDYAFDSWQDLILFARNVQKDGPMRCFELAVEAVISGDLPGLQAMLRQDPDLAQARSPRRHKATLLHYTAANGVENFRQKTPANAVEIMRTLFAAGSEADATAWMYETNCTTMSMLVSSVHPFKAGLQGKLAEVLLDHGAALEDNAEMALRFGYRDTALTLVRRGASVEKLTLAAGLGLADKFAQLLPSASADDRHQALALAAQHGHIAVLKLLIESGEDLNRYNPLGFHDHSTPLHQAVSAGQEEAVKLLVNSGAKFDILDKLYNSTALGWAIHYEQFKIADFLRASGATG